MKSILIFTLLISLFAASAGAVTPEWEAEVLKEAKNIKTKAPEKEFFLFLMMAREFAANGKTEKAKQYYQLAFDHPNKFDKSEAAIELVALSRKDKKDLALKIIQAQAWFKKHPSSLTSELKSWLSLMKGYAQGSTPETDVLFHKIWVQDERVAELMKQGKPQEAYLLLGPGDTKNSNINTRIRQDLLAAISLGKKATPPFTCLSSLTKYPESITWSMRICRYLVDWQAERKSKETVETIKAQLQKENPERIYYAELLRKL